jgi:hypothetical protein
MRIARCPAADKIGDRDRLIATRGRPALAQKAVSSSLIGVTPAPEFFYSIFLLYNRREGPEAQKSGEIGGFWGCASNPETKTCVPKGRFRGVLTRVLAGFRRFFEVFWEHRNGFVGRIRIADDDRAVPAFVGPQRPVPSKARHPPKC